MKQITVIILLLLTTLFAQALTPKGLINKYKKMPDAVIQEVNKKNLKNMMDSTATDADIEAWRTINKMTAVVLPLDDEQLETLSTDLNDIKDYSLSMSFDMSDGSEKPKPANLIQSVFSMFSTDSMTLTIFSKNSSADNYLLNPIMITNVFDLTFIICIDGKLRPDNAQDLIEVSHSETITSL